MPSTEQPDRELTDGAWHPVSAVGRARRGPRAQRRGRRPLARADAVRRPRSARWRTTARTRAARSARARSRRACCAARGTATTTTRSPGGRRAASATPSPAYAVEERADGVYVELPEPVQRRRAPSPTCSSRRSSPSASPMSSAWSGTPTSASPTRCAGPRSAASSRYIGIRHEGAAAFAASAYGKLTGRPAACFAIAGPGSTNLLTGLYDAKLDGVAGRSRSPARCRRRCCGRGAFQDLDLSARLRATSRSPRRPCSPAATTPSSPRSRSSTRRDGRGVAHLVLPDEVQVLPSDAPAASPDGPLHRPAASCPTRRPGARGRPGARPPGGR